MHLAKQAFKRWARIVSKLTLDEAVEILRGLETNYLEDWIAVYCFNKQHSGALDTLAQQYHILLAKKWQRLSCQFMGGPTGDQTFTATMGTYVLDCLMREIHRHGHNVVYSVVYNVLKKGNRVICLLT